MSLSIAVAVPPMPQLPSEQILVGDIIRLTENEEIPCDVVLLSTSDPTGNCFIQVCVVCVVGCAPGAFFPVVVGRSLRARWGVGPATSCLSYVSTHAAVVLRQTTNLDGESNLKTRTAPAETRALTDDARMSTFHGVVKCGAPDEKLYKFDSQLRLGEGEVISLSAEQLLLQATHLRNTEFVYGVVVYTGTVVSAPSLRSVRARQPPAACTEPPRCICSLHGVPRDAMWQCRVAPVACALLAFATDGRRNLR